MTPKSASLAAAILLAAMFSAPARAQLMGNEGWNYSSGSSGRTFHAQGQLLRKQSSAIGSASGSGGAVVSNSTTVGNINQITQILSEGSEGYLNTNSDQTASGNQSATATNNSTQVPAQSGNGQ